MHIITRVRLLKFAEIQKLLEQTKTGWPFVAEAISLPHTQEEYERSIALLDELIDEVGEAEDHPFAALMETLGSLIEAYEDDHLPELMGDPLSTLRFLMEDHGLTNANLPEIGEPATIAAILNGQQELTATQMRLLGQRFHVAPAVFL